MSLSGRYSYAARSLLRREIKEAIQILEYLSTNRYSTFQEISDTLGIKERRCRLICNALSLEFHFLSDTYGLILSESLTA
ncbi:MAG: hypothetical protein F6K40_20385 [Okeania sp. SIO3I5]|uniref:hypothetical protein n=1 Tax=Okeania sp. SIO3I5 TaxID=2607805 RepID=UPI0013BD0B2E|nr:hypothetical protein [Okeania sp. SIO3I5]NEQ38496.1 hypothetical protein [Okeania sp. SIO3I5]